LNYHLVTAATKANLVRRALHLSARICGFINLAGGASSQQKGYNYQREEGLPVEYCFEYEHVQSTCL
jgi:hypothetical protein